MADTRLPKLRGSGQGYGWKSQSILWAGVLTLKPPVNIEKTYCVWQIDWQNDRQKDRQKDRPTAFWVVDDDWISATEEFFISKPLNLYELVCEFEIVNWR